MLNISNLFSHDKYTLKPSLSEKFRGIIWKIEIDDLENIIALETRDIESHTAGISAFDFKTGECLFREVIVENSWHWGLDRVHKGITFLHSYVSEENPEHKGIIALDRGGKTLWQHFNKTLHTISPEGLIVYDPKMQPKWLELLEPETGILLTSNVKEYSLLKRDIEVPHFINNPELHPNWLPENVIGELAFFNYNRKKCYAFHIKYEDHFIQQIIIKEADTILLKDILSDNIRKLNPEAFFISHGYLFYIRDEKREIVSYLV